MTRLRSTLIAAALLLTADVHHVRAQNAEFVQGMNTRAGAGDRDEGAWRRVVAFMRAAIAKDSNESSRRLNLSGGSNFQNYLPHFFLGEALVKLNRCDEAVPALQESDRQGVAARHGKAGDLKGLLAKCGAPGGGGGGGGGGDPAFNVPVDLQPARNAIQKAQSAQAELEKAWTDAQQRNVNLESHRPARTQAASALNELGGRLTSGADQGGADAVRAEASRVESEFTRVTAALRDEIRRADAAALQQAVNAARLAVQDARSEVARIRNEMAKDPELAGTPAVNSLATHAAQLDDLERQLAMADTAAASQAERAARDRTAVIRQLPVQARTAARTSAFGEAQQAVNGASAAIQQLQQTFNDLRPDARSALQAVDLGGRVTGVLQDFQRVQSEFKSLAPSVARSDSWRVRDAATAVGQQATPLVRALEEFGLKFVAARFREFSNTFTEMRRQAREIRGDIDSRVRVLQERKLWSAALQQQRTTAYAAVDTADRAVEASLRAENEARLPADLERMKQSVAGLQQVQSDFARELVRTLQVPPALLRAAEHLFSGQYAEALGQLRGFDDRSAPAAFQLQACIFRTASTYALFVLSGEKNTELRKQSEDLGRQCKHMNPNYVPLSRAFSPRFLQFYLGLPAAAPGG